MFTKLDLAEGYQILIRAVDQEKTAFATQFGLVAMPFRLTNAPATFQRTMEAVLRKHIEEGRARVYLDDVLISSQQKDDHKNEVVAVCRDVDVNKLSLSKPRDDTSGSVKRAQ